MVVGPNIGAVGAGRNFGRFAYILGSPCVHFLKVADMADSATQKDVLSAELVYQPQKFRLANVTIRPAIRRAEIHLGGCVRQDGIECIPLDELTVSVRHGRFCIRWLRNNTEIRIVSGHVLNYLTAPDIVRFLAEVGQDAQAQLSGFSWGPAEGFAFLPRVQHGRVVLRLAEWRISSVSASQDFKTKSLDEFFDDLCTWRLAWKVPRYVYLSYADNRLLLDLETHDQIEELFQEVKGLKSGSEILLQESLPDLDQLWVKGSQGSYYSELVIPLSLAPQTETVRVTSKILNPAQQGHINVKLASSLPSRPSDFLRPPGSEWLYVKLYCGEASQDELIAGPLRSYCQRILSEGMAARWFFLRDTDPDPHLRIRFYGAPDVLIARVMPDLFSWASGLVLDQVIHRFMVDTYDREIERYGGPEGIAVAEKIFHLDSASVADFKDLLTRRETDCSLEDATVVTLDNLLDSLGMTSPEKIAWLKKVVTWRAEVGPEYRRRQQKLRSLLSDSPQTRAESLGEPFSCELRSFREAMLPLATELSELAAAGELSRPLDDLYASMSHLHCNRMIGIDIQAERVSLGLLLRALEGLQEHVRRELIKT